MSKIKFKFIVLFLFALLSLSARFLAAQTEEPLDKSKVENRSNRANKVTELQFDPELFPFYHGVASGDPLENQVIVWTRVTPEEDQEVEVEWRIGTDPNLSNVIQTGKVITSSERDYTVKVDVKGLEPGKTYYYGFKALGRYSLIGRTKTTPTATQAKHLRFAVVSCNNFEAGYFNAFARIGDRNDLDAVIHLGDYIYEYEPQKYGDPSTKRFHVPAKEIVELADYRTRYSLYRLDPQLRHAHQQHPFIAVWDDHESANDSYKDGAENHQPDKEGSWEVRKSVAKKAYFEWLPVRENADRRIYRTFQYGNLAELIMLDTRLEGREEQPQTVQEAATQNKSMLGKEQYKWFTDALSASKAKWKIIGNQVIFSELNVGFINPAKPDSAESLFLDIWDGYPAERRQIMDHIANNKINNVVFLTGDFHSTFAFDVTPTPLDPRTYDPATGRGAIAVEFATSSITSANFDEYLGSAQAAQIEFIINKPIPQAGNINFNPHMKNVDLDRNGYIILDVTEQWAQGNWYYVETILNLNDKEYFDKAFFAKEGENFLRNANTPSAEKNIKDLPAPAKPPVVTGLQPINSNRVTVLSSSPNPFSVYLNLHYYLTQEDNVEITVRDVNGKVLDTLLNEPQVKGFYNLEYDSRHLAKGTYFLTLKTSGQTINRKIIKN